MQNKYQQHKGAKVIKRIKAEIWYANQIKLSYTELKKWLQARA